MLRFPIRVAALVAAFGACATAQAATPEFNVTGGWRARYETLDGQFRPGLGGSDHLFTVRSNLAVEMRLAPLTLGAEVIDSHAYAIDRGGTFGPGTTNAFEPSQLYAQLDLHSTQWTVGQFGQDLGSRRLIASSRAGNSVSVYAGARGAWHGEAGDTLTGLLVMPTIRKPTSEEAAYNNEAEVDDRSWDYRFYGLYYTSRPLVHRARLETHLFRLVDVDEPDRATRDRRMTLTGVRLYRNPREGAFDFEVEGLLQKGQARRSASAKDLRDLDVSAGYLHAEVGYSIAAPLHPRVEFAYDYGSGDGDPTDGTYTRFDPILGTKRMDLGPGGLYGPLSRSNISSPGVRADIVPNGLWDAYLAARAFWLADRRDAFGSTGVQDPTGRSGRFAGYQLEGRGRRRLTPNFMVEAGGGWLLPQGFLKRAPNANEIDRSLYGYLDLIASF